MSVADRLSEVVEHRGLTGFIRWPAWPPAGVATAALAAFATGHPTIAGPLLLIAAIWLGFASPGVAMAVILGCFPVQPLAVRVLERDLGVSGLPLVLASAWKEGALAAMLIVVATGAARAWTGSTVSWPRVRALDVLAAILLLLVVVNLALAPSMAGLNQARLLLFPIAVYVAIRLRVLLPHQVLIVFTASSVAIAAFAIYQSGVLGFAWVQHYFGTTAMPIPSTFVATFVAGPRASGTLGSPNEFAFLAASVACVALALPWSTIRRGVLPMATIVAILLTGLLLSVSRSALLGGVAGIMVTAGLLTWIAGRTGQSRVLVLAVLVPAFVIATAAFASRNGLQTLTGSVQTIAGQQGNQPGDAGGPSPSTEPGTSPRPSTQPGTSPQPRTPVDSSTAAHISSLSEGLSMLSANPFGLGLGKVGAHGLPGSAEGGLIVESWYLSMGLALGIPGLFLALAVIAAMVWQGANAALSRRSRIGAALAGVAAMAGIVGIVLPTMLEPQLAMIPWALSGAFLASATPGTQVLDRAHAATVSAGA